MSYNHICIYIHRYIYIYIKICCRLPKVGLDFADEHLGGSVKRSGKGVDLT